MAYNKKYPNIKRTGGPYPRNRYGVRYDSISKQQRRLLLDYPIIKDRAQSDQFLHIIFEICRYHKADKNNKYYYDWSKDEFSQLDKLEDSYKTVEWQCALSDLPIEAKIDDFSAKNFVHPKYHDTLGGVVDGRILKSSVAFRKHVKKILMKEQKDFLRLAKKNSSTKL